MSPPRQPVPAPNDGARTRFSAGAARPPHRIRRVGGTLVALLAAAAVLTAFLPAPQGERRQAAGPAQQLRLGYFATITHAPALIAESRGLLGQALQPQGTELVPQVFSAGPAAIEALNSGALDAAYLGPSPALNSYLSSGGKSLRIIAGATESGASLVVDPTITTVPELAGRQLATPQYGGTQDVALRHFLAEHQLSDAVSITPTSNGTVAQLFARGAIDGAWLPEPYASLLVERYGARRLVDEASLWPQGRFPTTVLVARTEFIDAHPQTVARLAEANTEAIAWLNQATTDQQVQAVQQALAAANGASLPRSVIRAALAEVDFSPVPDGSSFTTLVQHAAEVGLGQPGDVSGLIDRRWVRHQEEP